MKRLSGDVPLNRASTSARAYGIAMMVLATLVAGLGSGNALAAGEKSAVAALVKVDDAWVRATVKGQTASGGFMSLTASQDVTLVGFTTPAASDTELHEMVLEDGVMRMRAIESLPLRAGQQVQLKPGAGAQHLMLMGLKQPLIGGRDIPLTLKLRTAAGKLVKQDINVPVKAGMQASPKPLQGHKGSGAGSAPHSHHGHDHAH